ncbi:MAG: hypothetical protein NVV59_03875 [Chitinophagaceae bacterium]|nr:hypothetical protein [Chitinophagaceae bacterium]
MSKYHLDYLEQLEAESIHIMREVAAQFEKPALLFSGERIRLRWYIWRAKPLHPGAFLFRWFI